MANVLNGTDLMLFITQGGTAKTIAFAKSHKLDIKGKTREISSKDSGIWDEKVMGRLGWSISADAMATIDQPSFNYDDLVALMVARTPIAVFSSTATGTAPGWVHATGAGSGYTGNAIITDLSLDAKDDDNATFSITLEGTGPLTAIA